MSRNLNTTDMRNSAELESGPTEVIMTTTPPLEATCIPRGFGTDPGPSAAATARVPATSREDSGSQAILRYQLRNGSDYRFYYYPQLQKMATYIASSNSNRLEIQTPYCITSII